MENKLWKILKEIGISDHLTCLLRNLYAGQEATVRTGHGTMGGGGLVAKSCLTLMTPWTAALQASLSITMTLYRRQ